jgi:ankyrin repeat protein
LEDGRFRFLFKILRVFYSVIFSVDVNARHGEALRLSAKNGHTEVVKILLEVLQATFWLSQFGTIDSPVNQKHGANHAVLENCPLRLACQNGHMECAKLLLQAGSNPGSASNYAIIRASENGHAGIVELLMKHKCCVCSRHKSTSSHSVMFIQSAKNR